MSRLNPVHYRKLCKILERAGCVFSHQTGDHLIYHKKGCPRAVVVPRWREIPEFIILNNLKTAKIDRQTYLELLKEI
jgi:predicted RNA binding protein YcfA (HicA-like mRNA interferase family)